MKKYFENLVMFKYPNRKQWRYIEIKKITTCNIILFIFDFRILQVRVEVRENN